MAHTTRLGRAGEGLKPLLSGAIRLALPGLLQTVDELRVSTHQTTHHVAKSCRAGTRECGNVDKSLGLIFGRVA